MRLGIMVRACTVGCAALALALEWAAVASCAGSPERTERGGGADGASTATEGGRSTADMGAGTADAIDATDATSDAGGSGGACRAPCTEDLTCCDGACVDFRNNATHCGSCSTACNASAMEVCASGLCGALNWALWPMPNGQDDVSAGAPNPDAYTDNLDGTVSDRVTHLMWQQQVPTTGGPSEDGNLTWGAASKYCAALSASGQDDWRLPSQIELVSLDDYSNMGQGQPSIDSTAFPDTPLAAFWSSTRLAGAETNAWAVYFDAGFTYAYDASDMGTVARVRCVR